MTPVSITFKIEKADKTGRYVAGWLSVVEKDGKRVEDTQGDLISMDELRKGVHRYMNGERTIKKQHSGGEIGKMVEVVMIDDDFAKAHGVTHSKRGAWGTAEITDEATREDVRKGKVTGWSMGGRGKRTPIVKAGFAPLLETDDVVEKKLTPQRSRKLKSVMRAIRTAAQDSDYVGLHSGGRLNNKRSLTSRIWNDGKPSRERLRGLSVSAIVEHGKVNRRNARNALRSHGFGRPNYRSGMGEYLGRRLSVVSANSAEDGQDRGELVLRNAKRRFSIKKAIPVARSILFRNVRPIAKASKTFRGQRVSSAERRSMATRTLPTLRRHEGSWIATAPGGGAREFFTRSNAQRALNAGWKVKTAGAHLGSLSRRSKVRKARGFFARFL